MRNLCRAGSVARQPRSVLCRSAPWWRCVHEARPVVAARFPSRPWAPASRTQANSPACARTCAAHTRTQARTTQGQANRSTASTRVHLVARVQPALAPRWPTPRRGRPLRSPQDRVGKSGASCSLDTLLAREVEQGVAQLPARCRVHGRLRETGRCLAPMAIRATSRATA